MKRHVPTPDETAAQMRRYEDRQAHLKDIAAAFRDDFVNRCPLHFVSLYSYDEGKISVRVVLKRSDDMENVRDGVVAQDMKTFIADRLTQVGRAGDVVGVSFDFDFHERPKAPVPIDHEKRVAAAKAQDPYDFTGIDEVCDAFKLRFADASLDYVTVMPSPSEMFAAYVFFKAHEDVTAAEASGLDQQMMDAMRALLIEHGRSPTTIEFEFDSRENVDRNYEGNYFLRLR